MGFTLHDGRIPMCGTPDGNAMEQIVRGTQHAQFATLMGDRHLGYAVPIRSVAAHENHISPSGVGYDIAYGK